MKRGVLAFWGLMLLTVAGLYTWRMQRQEATLATAVQVPVDQVTQVAPFELIDSRGEPFNSAELEGQVWVASFFFANCPGSCIALNQQIKKLQDDLGDLPVRFVSISVDPEWDTPERLAEYSERMQADPARWTFLTGTMEQIQKVGQESFLVSLGLRTHTDRLILVDQEGMVQGRFFGTKPAEVEMLKRKLARLCEDAS